jgi:hypothetical protein
VLHTKFGVHGGDEFVRLALNALELRPLLKQWSIFYWDSSRSRFVRATKEPKSLKVSLTSFEEYDAKIRGLSSSLFDRALLNVMWRKALRLFDPDKDWESFIYEEDEDSQFIKTARSGRRYNNLSVNVLGIDEHLIFRGYVKDCNLCYLVLVNPISNIIDLFDEQVNSGGSPGVSCEKEKSRPHGMSKVYNSERSTPYDDGPELQ